MSLKKIFITSSNSIVENIIHYDICPDNYVGCLTINNKKIKGNLFLNCAERYKAKETIHITKENIRNKNIVIVLESPHVDEYECLEFINPALGPTGNNLQQYFTEKVEKFIKNYDICDGDYSVFLINAIQYQCSLGIHPMNRKIRDRMFLEMWLKHSAVRADFKNRLRELNPSIIINCCTTGDSLSKKIIAEIIGKEIKRNEYAIGNIYSNRVFESNKNRIKEGTKYFLHGFVQTAIDQVTGKNTEVKLLKSKHPCIWSSADKIIYYHHYHTNVCY